MSVAMAVNNLVKGKKAGDTWVCYQAPEEFRMWNAKDGWKSMVEYGVTPIFVKVRGLRVVDSNTLIATNKQSKILKCGLPVVGSITISTERRCNWTVRVDGTKEINQAFGELANEYGFEQFEVREMEVLNKNGAIIFCEVYNPDGNGCALYCLSIELDGEKRYAPNMDEPFQEKYIDKFRGTQKARCGSKNLTVIASGCAIEHDIPSKTVIRIPKKQKAEGLQTA